MIKLKPLLFENKILIPRRSPEDREKTHIAEHYRIIQKYIKDGNRGELSLYKSPIKILPDNLTRVVGELNLGHSKIEDLNNLERVRGNLYLTHTQYLKSLGKLREVNFLDLSLSSIKKLPETLTHIKGSLELYQSEVEDLNKLEIVNKNLNAFMCKNLKSLGKLREVDGRITLSYTQITRVPDFIVNVNGSCGLSGLKIEDLNNLETVRGSLYLNDTPNLKSIGKLKYVGDDLELKGSNLTKIMSEKEIRRQVRIEGNIYFY
jgi:hypothetical protein